MQKFFFTFGSGQPYAGKCLPVFAKDDEAAREYMFECFGDRWCWQYSAEEWELMKNDPYRRYPLEEEMNPVVAGED